MIDQTLKAEILDKEWKRAKKKEEIIAKLGFVCLFSFLSNLGLFEDKAVTCDFDEHHFLIRNGVLKIKKAGDVHSYVY